ncbi:hypothetical protein [Bradyrhizobium sp. CCBAU 11434]|uniref:hypothetical protein n=1 Tax=Bradyrhizobium sp. CCBAU 11434 TaxID=1630885 RepID=UPI00230696C1|nr:hypothetical protein [Bradyrhizobium sp. CCBAU 11434]
MLLLVRLFTAGTISGSTPPSTMSMQGSISIGPPSGMTGARPVGYELMEGKRRGVKYLVVTIFVEGGMGAAGLFEVA